MTFHHYAIIHVTKILEVDEFIILTMKKCNDEESFNELYLNTSFDYPSDLEINFNVSENNSLQEDCDESDIVPSKQLKVGLKNIFY